MDYSKMGIVELKATLKEKGAKGYSTLKKDDILTISRKLPVLSETFPVLVVKTKNCRIQAESAGKVLYSNDFKILDKDIPFYELVFHGYVDFSGEPLNLADSYEISLLKCVTSSMIS